MLEYEPWIVALEGVTLIAVGLPMYWRWIPPNRFYGFRVAATLAEPRRWYVVNRLAGRRLVLTGVAAMLAGGFASALGLPAAMTSAVVTAVGALAVAVLGWRDVVRDVASTGGSEGG